jgi:hypothetical protein
MPGRVPVKREQQHGGQEWGEGTAQRLLHRFASTLPERI